ncbi:MAG: ABC transporter ATP-binding protein [Clostridia bacterium]|nr:MAG: ABC transporter ATP-binding protein [Clostridia bacterium]
MKDILVLNGISKQYGEVYALKDVGLRVTEGQWVSIMGPSGSGKSTLLNIMSCLDRPTTGSVLLDGVEIAHLDERALTVIRREKVGLVFQQFHLIPHLTAVENVMLAQYYHSLPDEKEALQALERVGLRHRARHLPSQLSGGEQQRVCIARALINEPAIILADEPTGNLDAANEETVVELFRELHRAGHTIIMVTHDPEIGALADRRLFLEHGREGRGQPGRRPSGQRNDREPDRNR